MAGLIALIVPVVGIFIGRLMANDMTSNLWTYFPLFWVPPFSLAPAIMIWTGKIGNATPSTAAAATAPATAATTAPATTAPATPAK